MREEDEARHYGMMVTGTRTISSIVPSRGLSSYTSTMPMMSLGGGVNVAVTLYVPRAGAPALAVVWPDASTRPALSVIRQLSAASKTLASPLIVTGERTREFASGRTTVMKPRADTSGVALAGAAVVGAGVEGVGVAGLGDGVTM